jgi:hypothetical protein
MDDKVRKLKYEADAARLLYKQNQITREFCKQLVQPYIDYYNEKSTEIAKKHGVKPKFINFISYIR